MVLKRNKKIGIVFLVFCFLFIYGNPVLAAGAAQNQADQSATRAVNYLNQYYSNAKNSGTGWAAIGLYGMNKEVHSNFYGCSDKTAQGSLDSLDTTTDAARMILVRLATETDPANIVNSLAKSQLANGKFPDNIKSGGEELVNSHIWAMIALKAAGAHDWDVKAAVDWLGKMQNSDGGFNFLAGSQDSDIDVTASAVIALALSGQGRNDPVVAKALEFLQSRQLNNGGFAGWYTENTESTALVIQALVALDIDPVSPEWVKTSVSPVEALLAYQLADGSFAHIKDGNSNIIATEQALLALGDYINESSVYSRLKNNIGQTAKSSGNSDIRADYWAYESINNLVKGGVMNGYPDGTFRPEKPITRAEFAKVITLASGTRDIDSTKPVVFTDAGPGHWAGAYINVCVSKDWMQGVGNQTFSPDSTLKGAQLITVVSRIKGLQVDAKIEGDEWYKPYVDTAAKADLLYPGFSPESNATRAQCAYMINQAFK
ncbi:MAG: S-layer homology domain-containing protein [Syntrophomonadaceae bacterium]|nr:S-layer homology domain-containing protein [Syntrophomonadaceae bacterium]